MLRIPGALGLLLFATAPTMMAQALARETVPRMLDRIEYWTRGVLRELSAALGPLPQAAATT